MQTSAFVVKKWNFGFFQTIVNNTEKKNEKTRMKKTKTYKTRNFKFRSAHAIWLSVVNNLWSLELFECFRTDFIFSFFYSRKKKNRKKDHNSLPWRENNTHTDESHEQ